MATPQHVPGSFGWFECGTTDVGAAGLYNMTGPQFEGVPPHWATYVTVEDVDQSADRAQSLGGKIVAPPMDVPGVGRMAVVEDPTGAKIAVFRPGAHPGTAQLGPEPGTFGWSELATRDTAAAKAFYTELFHWGAKVDDNSPISYTEFQLDGTSIGGMMEMTPQHGDAPPHWMPYVLVADCDATAAKVTDLGGRLVVPPTDIPDVGSFSVFMDPVGAMLAVVKLGA